MVNVNDMLKRHACYFLEKNTGKENDRQGKRTGEKRKQKILAFHLQSFLSF